MGNVLGEGAASTPPHKLGVLGERCKFPHWGPGQSPDRSRLLCVFNSDVTRNFTLGGAEAHGECGARGYNGGLGAEPPAGSRGRAPGQGVRGRSPLKLRAFSWMYVPRIRQISPFLMSLVTF